MLFLQAQLSLCITETSECNQMSGAVAESQLGFIACKLDCFRLLVQLSCSVIPRSQVIIMHFSKRKNYQALFQEKTAKEQSLVLAIALLGFYVSGFNSFIIPFGNIRRETSAAHSAAHVSSVHT